jgi:hypothetical protein
LFSAKFKDLVANEMEETAGRFNKKIMQKKKEARGRPLWNELKSKVEHERARDMRSKLFRCCARHNIKRSIF